jgi:hypothetical protein
MRKSKHQTVADPSLSGGCKSREVLEAAAVCKSYFMYGSGTNAWEF